jgi:hypothetical protein
MSKNSPEQVKAAGKLDINIQGEILNPIAQSELDIHNPGEETPNPSAASPTPDPVVVNNISEHPKTNISTTVHILDGVCDNLNKAFNSTVTAVKSKTTVAQRVAQGIAETGEQLDTVANISKYAATGLCIVGVASAAAAWPALVGIAAVSVILSQISKIIRDNRELEELILIVNSQIQRIHNIYCVLEEISNENRFPINTEMLKKYLIIILSNILLACGKDTYKQVIDGLEMNHNIKDLEVSVTSTVAPGHSQAVGLTFFQYILGRKKVEAGHADLNATTIDFQRAKDRGKKNEWYNNIIDKANRIIDAKEVTRGISRDLLILNVYFSILLSEFDILSREFAEKQKVEYLKQIELAQMETSLEKKVSALLLVSKLQNTKSIWPSGETYKKFYNQLPKSNMTVFMIENSTGQTLQEIMTGKPEIVPSTDGISPSKLVFKPELKELMKKLGTTRRSLNLNSLDPTAQSPSTLTPTQPPRGGPPVTFGFKGGRFTLRKSRGKLNTRGIYK